MNNAYKPSESSLRAADAIDVGNRKMFKVSGVGVATVMGGLIAGGWLLSKNFKAMGKLAEARQALVYSALGMLAIFGVAVAIPDSWGMSNIVLLVPQIVAMHRYAKQTQQAAIDAHRQRGGQLESNWRAAGIGLLITLSIVAVIVPIVVAVTWKS